ncbi:retrovirus-related pol polyprotein from transposon TNT 1-94 [Tanacetum coccineum]
MQDFVIIKDFKDFSNEMMYIVQEIFFKLHQGPGIDDHARTFSSFLLAEIDKRNLNPLKQMRTIEQTKAVKVIIGEIVRGGQLNAAPLLEVENFTNWKKRPGGPSDVKESRIMDLKLCYNTFKFKEGKTLTQTFTIYKALMYELVNDGINLSKLEINTGFINRLLKKWLSFCQSLRNTNHVKESELAFLFDIPDDEEDTRSSQEYMNDLEEEYQAIALLAKSKSSSQNKLELRPTKDFEAKYNKVKVKLALLSSSTSAPKVSMIKNKGLIIEAYEWDEEEVSSDDNEMVEVKVLMALVEDNDDKKKYLDYLQKDLVFVKSSNDDIKVSISGFEIPWLSEVGGFILPNHDIGRILTAESQRNTTDPSVVVTDSLATDYDLADESSVCSTHLPPLEKLTGVEPVSGPKTIKSILKSNSTFKVEVLKCVIINEPSSAPAKSNKSASALKISLALAGKLNNVKFEDDPPLAIVMKELNKLKLQISKNQSSYSRNNKSQQSDVRKHIWYLDNECTRHMTGFDEKRGIIFNSNKEVVMIALRVRDVYVLNMTSSAQETCFFAKSSKNLNWLWHKRLAHLNFKTINKLAKQNLVIGLPLLVYSKDKPCSSCEQGKHHKASFKTKQTSSIKKCLHLLHIDLFGPVSPRSINHEKYTLFIVDKYSRYTWVYFMKKKSKAPETIMSFIKRVENQNDI